MKKNEIVGINETYYYHKLDNGLEIYMLPNNKINNYYITLSTKYGSINTHFKYNNQEYNLPKGIAHYLEHLMFKMPDEDSFEFFSRNGASNNAYTSYDITSYEVFANTCFNENLDYLLKMVYTPYFTKELIEKERGIITSEIKMYEDDPSTELLTNLYRNIFINDERQYLIGGTVDDIKKITKDDIDLVYNAFYHPANMFLVITGNFVPEEALAVISERMKKLSFDKYIKPEVIGLKEPFKVKNDFAYKNMNVDQNKVSIGYKIPKSNFKKIKLDDYELKLYLSIYLTILFGRTSKLREDLEDSNIITSGLNYSVDEIDDYYIFTVLSSTDYPDYFVSKIDDALNNDNCSNEELVRKIKVNVSNLIMGVDDIEFINDLFTDDLIMYGYFINNRFNIYNSLKYDIFEKVVDATRNHKRVVSIIKPKDEK